MIEKLEWDSVFFNKKIGELKVSDIHPEQIEPELKKAERNGFKYIICKIESQEHGFVRSLEAAGFYISDIGLILSSSTALFLKTGNNKNSDTGPAEVASERHIPMLQSISKSIFYDSRFYSDPFFSKEEADNLFQAWIENSVKGQIADVVFFIQDRGFITCRKKNKNTGEIVLIGIKDNFRGMGFGTTLLDSAMMWFMLQNTELVNVRTQLKNIKAANFYIKSGFRITGSDIFFGKIL